ncbi:MAG: LacI family DNA-binding transcriptional regulator [Pyrinomonadaceae bacterium]
MSIKDVAREAGVSTATVSHVINNSRFVSEETRAKVLRAIERCNYYANAHARSLASGRSHILGLLISDIINPFFPELVKSIEAAAFERGFELMLSNSNYDPQRTSHYVKRFIERDVAGVALMTSEFDMDLVDRLARRHVPVVFLDLDAPGVNRSNLCVDYSEGIQEALRYLISLGHRDIAFVGGPEHLRSAIKRRNAFCDGLMKYLPHPVAPKIYEGNFKLEGGKGAANQILSAEKLPTAVMFANDLMALGAMQEFREAGLEIPRDISVVGFDDIAFASLANLTTVCLPRSVLGSSAVEALMLTVEHPDQEGMELHVPTYLIMRGSTAAVRNSEAEAKTQAGIVNAKRLAHSASSEFAGVPPRST